MGSTVNLKPNRPIRSSEQEIPVLRAQGWGWPTRGHPANSHRNPGTSTPSCKRSQNCQDLTGIWLLLSARLSRKAPPLERACTQRGRPQAHRRTQGPGPRLLRRKAGSSRSHDGWQYARRPSANRRSPGHGARFPGRLKQTRHERRVTEAKEQAALQRKLAERRGAGLIRAEQRRAPRDPEQKRTWRGRRERTGHRKARPRKRAQTSPHAPLPAAELWPSGSGADGCRGGGGAGAGKGAWRRRRGRGSTRSRALQTGRRATEARSGLQPPEGSHLMTEERRTSTSRRLERGPCVPGTRSTCAKRQDEKVGLLGRSAPATSPQGPGPATKPPQAHKPSSVPQSPQANSWPCGWAWSGTAWGRGSPCPRGRGRQGRDRGPEPGSELPASTKQKAPPPPPPPTARPRPRQEGTASGGSSATRGS